ncbi:MAG: M24 family metallopeptidase [Alphaproteobacteria bacterium]
MEPAFPESEHRERLDRCRQALRRAGFNGCIAVAPEHLYYLGGYDAHTHFSEQALVFSTDRDEPTLLIRDVDVPLARETSWVKDVRTYHFGADDPALMVARIAREKGLIGKRVGTDLAAYALPAAYGRRLAQALESSTLDDSTDVVGKLRVIKSPREQAYVRQAAGHAKAGLKAALAKAGPGMTEIQLAGEIEYAMRSRGCDYSAMPTWVASGPRTPLGHATPTDRVLERGDLVHVEFAGVARRYHCVSMQTFSLGEPRPRVREICQASRESVLAGVAAIRPGAPVSGAETASLEPLAKRGLRQYAMMRFGVGISAGYPPSWLEPLHIIAESKDVFQPGMVFYVHTVLEIPEEGIGTLMGGSYLLTAEGPEQLDGATPELTVL